MRRTWFQVEAEGQGDKPHKEKEGAPGGQRDVRREGGREGGTAGRTDGRWVGAMEYGAGPNNSSDIDVVL
jgi:hypothetical protein